MPWQWQILIAAFTVAGAGGVAGLVTAWSKRPVDAATSRKIDTETATLLLAEHRKDNAALREEIGVLKSDVDQARRESVELRLWAIELDVWARAAVKQIEELSGHIAPPPAPPDRRRRPRPEPSGSD